MEAYHHLRRESLEYSTLLWSLTETPGDYHIYKKQAATQSSRQLSMVEEIQLADAFAFIASWRDDPDNIMAACVEERHSSDTGIAIRVASNTGDPSGVVDKMQVVASAMMKASHRKHSRAELQQEVFVQMVEMCMDRILSRLRSCHARRTRKTTGKPCLPTQLLEAVKRCAVSAVGKKSTAAVRQVLHQANALACAFNLVETSLEGRPRKLRVMGLLERASQCDVTALSEVLSFDRSLDPSLKSHLPKAVSKIARYFELSHYFVNAARTRKHFLFQNIRVMAVRHPTFNPQHVIGPFRPFGELLEGGGRQKHEFTRAARRSESEYRSRLSNSLGTWKVHAEIQILMFYEMTPQPVQPRIISASKLACFCCDLFIRSHGAFCVPGTHGRIYNTWTLPEVLEDNSPILARISVATQRFISDLRLISIPHAMGRRGNRPQPAESDVFTLEPWSTNSTIRQISDISVSTREKAISHHQLSAIRSRTSCPSSASSDETIFSLKHCYHGRIDSNSEESVGERNSERSRSTALPRRKDMTAPSLDTVSSNTALNRNICSSKTTLIMADFLHLFLSVERASEEALSCPDKDRWGAFSFRLENVCKRERKEEALEQMYPVIDVDFLEEGRDYMIPIRPGASVNRMMLRNDTQQLLLLWTLAEKSRCPKSQLE